MVFLNLGCGSDMHGEIRIDINPDRPGLNLIGDAHHLPIRDKVINHVFCKSVLEHLKSSFKGLSEMKRISKNRITVIIPNVYHWNRIMRNLIVPRAPINRETVHFQSWDAKAFKFLVNQVRGLKIVSIRWGVFKRRIHRPSMFFGQKMIVEMCTRAEID